MVFKKKDKVKAEKPPKAPKQKKTKQKKPPKAERQKLVKNCFVLTVGDNGAILTHYSKGRLENRLFADSSNSPEVENFTKLVSTYPGYPMYLLVDVIEQNYIQQALPPVSQFALKQQVDRRINKEFKKEDFNNYINLGRAKEGRKDWNVLLVSLSNSSPFKDWLEFVLNQKNDFKGVYLLPIEVQSIASEMLSKGSEKSPSGWELLVFDNKVGAFRVVALYGGKLVFTRLAQQLTGNNTPDIIVGTMEQEISNTVEYLKRLGFKSESDAKLAIVASSAILSRMDKKSLKFGIVELDSPHELAKILNLEHCSDEQDKFADIVIASHFAAKKKPALRFTSKITRLLDNIDNARKFVLLLILFGFIWFGYSSYNQVSEILEFEDQKDSRKLALMRATQKYNEIKKKHDALPTDVNKMIDIMFLSKKMHKEEDLLLKVFANVGNAFGEGKSVSKVTVEFREPAIAGQKKQNNRRGNPFAGKNNEGKLLTFPFEAEFVFEYSFFEDELDLINQISEKFLESLRAKFPDYSIEYSMRPVSPKRGALEEISSDVFNSKERKKIEIPSRIKVRGSIDEEKTANS